MRVIKVGIATLYRDNCNYGGLLQAFALQKVLSKYADDVEMLTLATPFSKVRLYARKVKLYSPKKVIQSIKRILASSNNDNSIVMKERKEAFKLFEESIKHSELINKNNYKVTVSNFDLLVAGSDQVWNPAVWEDCYFFKGIDSSKIRKVSYAASMGCSYINASDKRYLSNSLSDFYAISVREKACKDIIDEVANNCAVVLDPTLMITGDEWGEIIKRVKTICNKPYAFVYLVNKTQMHLRECITACKNAGLRCVIVSLDMRNFLDTPFDHSEDNLQFLTKCDPLMWVKLINDAKVVLTDSFHGVAFSTNLNRPFWCLSGTGLGSGKNNPDTRREDFLKEVGFGRRIVGSADEICVDEFCNDIDFSFANSVLRSQRKSSWTFIDYCFKDLDSKGTDAGGMNK